jgi:catechol 2,3-dioxygenase-like lactoylglutathione lyase family enzyme
MKRFHVHVAVDDLAQSTRFYSALFGAVPSVAKTDYAKWMLDDPRINFAISARGAKIGVDHLGFQVDSEEELSEIKAQQAAADLALLDGGAGSCCYANSEKHWLTDPQGIAWEMYRTMSAAQTFGSNTATPGLRDRDAADVSVPTASCEPRKSNVQSACC